MMKKLGLSLLVFVTTFAWAQVTPVQPGGTVMGVPAGSPAAPSALQSLPVAVSANAQVFATNAPYNAVCGDVGSQDVALNAILAAFPSGNVTIHLPDNCIFQTTAPVPITQSGVFFVADTPYSTQIDFEPSAAITSTAITGTTGQLSCNCTGLAAGEYVKVSGNLTGSGAISGYSNPTTYYVGAAANGSSGSFTLESLRTLGITNTTSVTATATSPAVFTGATLINGTLVFLGGTVPNGFSTTIPYCVVNASGNTFELATGACGAAINATTTGTSVTVSLSPAPQPITTTVGSTTGLTFTLAGGSAFVVGPTNNGEIGEVGFVNIGFISHDSTYTKTAIELIDSAENTLDNIYCGTSGVQWTGGSAISPDTVAGSICVRTRGREILTANKLTFRADRPEVISINPDAPNQDEDTNHFHWSGQYLAESNAAGPLVYIDSGVSMSSMLTDGAESFVGGTYGVYFNDTTSTTASVNNRWDNIDWEQAGSTSGYALYLHSNSQIQNTQVNSYICPIAANCTYLHNAFRTDFHTGTFSPSAAQTFVSMDATDFNTSWWNVQNGTNATVTATGQNLVWAYDLYPSTTIPSYAIYSNALEVSAATIGSPLTINLAAGSPPYNNYFPSWTTNGLGISMPAWTGHDTTATGTVAEEAMNALGAPTLTAANATTLTNFDNLYIAAPIASTNVTATNSYALHAAGNVLVDGSLTASGGITGGSLNIGEGGTPFIIMSCTMGNNGAISSCPTLLTTYANAWLYMPVDSISSSIPATAGWYLVQMSSTTAGTVCNNTYSSGDTVAPSCTAFTTTGPGAFAAPTGYETGPSYTLAANTLGINGRLEYEAAFTTQAANADTKDVYGWLGTSGNTCIGVAAILASATMTTLKGVAQNRGSAGSQVCYTVASYTSTEAGQLGPAYISIATGSLQNVGASFKCATTTDACILEQYAFTAYPSN